MGPVERWLGQIPKRVGGGDWDKRFAQRIAFVFETGKAGRLRGQSMQTDTIDRLFLELSQFSTATTAKELELKNAKDGAYLERNKCVALIARMALAQGLTAGVARTAIDGWSDDWHGCVYIDLPTGQVSWHYHDSQSSLFYGLPKYNGAWDGHDTPEKYARVLQAFRA